MSQQETMLMDSAYVGSTSSLLSRTRLAILLSLAFIIGLLPFASSLIMHFPDERYYSNGAVIMMQSGDYLRPRTPEGDVRLKKPPFTYWMSIAGMELFGISVIGARFYWLVCAAAIMLTTFQFTRILTGDDRTALLSSAMLASNFVFLRASINAIPDMPLTFFMLVGFIGFAGLLFREDRQKLYALPAYCGTGLAVLTKGLLPLAMAAYVIAFSLVVPSLRRRAHRLWNPAIILLSIVTFGAWFFYQSLIATSELASDFIGDQVADKVAIGIRTFSDGIIDNLSGLLLPIPIWLIMLVVGSKMTGKRPTWEAIGPSAPFIAGWVASVVLIFACTNSTSHRYVLPVLPLFCVLLASSLQSVMNRRAEDVLRKILRACMIFAAVALTAVLAIGFLLLSPVTIVGLAIATFAGLAGLWLYSENVQTDRLAVCLAFLMLGAGFVIAPVLRGLLLPDIGEVLAAKAKPSHQTGKQILFIGSSLDAAKVRLHMDRDRSFIQMHDYPQTGIAPQVKMVLTNEKSAADRLRAQGFSTEEVVGGWRDVQWQPFVAALGSGQLIDARNRYGQHGWIASRQQ